jgi:tetratricopeptide (TPR) repeat protein
MAEVPPTDSERQPARPFDTERLLRAVNRLQARQEFEDEASFRAFLDGFKGRPLEEIRAEAGTDEKEEAQELAYQALESRSQAEARRLAAQALERDPDCIDALNAMAGTESVGPEEAAHHMKEVAVKAEVALGEDFISENRGQLWGRVEARPYLRARMALASLLERSGKLKEALPHFEALLRFTEGDPQSVRYHLARCYAGLGQTKPLQHLLATWESDSGPVWAYMNVLLQLRLKQEKPALKALARARARNPHVEGFLTGTTKLPKEHPFAGLPGSPEEAAAALRFLAPAWTADREAMYWLFKVGKES